MPFYEQILYEIDHRLDALVDPETGELLDEEAFRALQMDRNALTENILLWYKNENAAARAVRAEANALAERAKALERRANGLKARAAAILEGRKFTTPRATALFRASSAVEVEDEALLAAWAERCGHRDCLLYRAPAVDRLAVKRLLKAGTEIPGARLVQRKNLVVK